MLRQAQHDIIAKTFCRIINNKYQKCHAELVEASLNCKTKKPLISERFYYGLVMITRF